MADSSKYKNLRKELVEKIRKKEINDKKVLEAIGRVQRHMFMDKEHLQHSYNDNAFPIGEGQTISQPYTVAFQTQLLNIKKGDKVLEIGTGSGYQTAVLLELGADVYTIERQKELYLKAQTLLTNLDYKPHFFYSDGYKGLPAYSPFDKILITAAAPYIPEKLKKQLKIGGIMVLPLGGSNVQIMTSLHKVYENKFEKNEFGGFVFVPLLKGKE